MSVSVRSLRSGRSNRAEEAPSQATRTRSRDRLRLLAEAIEGEIVPRLVAGYEETVEADYHRDRSRALIECRLCLPDSDPPTPAQEAARDLAFEATPQPAIDLAAMVLRQDDPDVLAHVTAAVAAQGLESVCLDLLAPAARHLGDLWCEDISSFTDVTIGLMRLQSALIAVTVPAPGLASGADGRRTILLAPVPGEQHSFGLTMVAGFFERAGWEVTQVNECAPEALEAAVRATWYGVVGLSAGSAAKLGSLPRILPRLRAASRNPDLGIMLGGPVFVAGPELARQLGADATAANGAHAVQVAEDLIAPRKSARMATG
jgi:methanogenic corrinoid protein MtbC1